MDKLIEHLPTDFRSEVEYFKKGEGNNYDAIIRANLDTKKDWEEYLQQFQGKQNIRWMVRSSNANPVRYILSQDYVCNKSSYRKAANATNSCEATLSFRIKLDTKKSRRNDKFIKTGLRGRLTLHAYHNHPTEQKKETNPTVEENTLDRPVAKRHKRVPESQQKTNLKNQIINKVRLSDESAFFVRQNPSKGREVVCAANFRMNDYLLEYKGELIDKDVAEIRDLEYSHDPAVGSYMYFFGHKCIDATEESPFLGRIINHEPQKSKQTAYSKIMIVDGIPRVLFFAKRNLRKGDVLSYDYGVRNKDFRWLYERSNF